MITIRLITLITIILTIMLIVIINKNVEGGGKYVSTFHESSLFVVSYFWKGMRAYIQL